jgi:tetratricopeptide (TPR) repeat protein
MDGRWSLRLAVGLIGGIIGCSGTQTRSPGDVMAQSEAATTKTLKAQQAAALTQDPPLPKDKRLKAETLVKLGALKDQAADEAERPQVERDAFRYQARQAYQKAIDQEPKVPLGYIALAGSFMNSGEHDRAYAVFDKGLKANPKSGQLWFELGAVRARAKDWTASLEALQRAAELDPDNKQYQKTLGLTYARTGQYDEAYAVLSRCMSEAEARFNVARMLSHMQQNEACQTQLQLALQANPNFLPAREMLDELANRPGVQPTKHEEPVK